MSPIFELGAEIERRWRGRDYDLRCFPDLCAEQLIAVRLPDRVGRDDLVRWALTSALPPQGDPKAKFGQPPITLFRTRRFHIDALFWVDGTTAIHDHGFSGAFQVLSGSSIETTFDFAVSRDVDGHIQLGDLAARGTALLRRGDVRPINAGPRYIHSLFHLPRPCVSLVIRTFWDPTPGVQLRYYPAGIAHDGFFEDDARDRRVQILEMLRETQDPSFDAFAGDLIEQADLHTIFAVVRASMRLRDSRRQEALLARVRDPAWARLFGEWVSQQRRLRILQNARANVHDPATRFLLAVLLNTHRRADALALVSAYAPAEDPSRQAAAWLRQLSTVSLPLQIAQGGWEPNILGLPAFEAGFEEALANTLAGRAVACSEVEEAFLGRLTGLPVLAPLFVA